MEQEKICSWCNFSAFSESTYVKHMRENHPDQFEMMYSGSAHDQNQIYQEEPKEEPLPGDQQELIEFRLVNKPYHLNCFVNSVI